MFIAQRQQDMIASMCRWQGYEKSKHYKPFKQAKITDIKPLLLRYSLNDLFS